MKTFKIFTATILTGTLLTGCVPSRKYEELQSKYDNCAEDLKKYKDGAEKWEKQLKDLQVEHEKLTDEVKQLRRDNEIKEESYENLTKRYDKLNEVNQTLLDQIERLQKLAENESAQLSDELKDKQLELLEKERELDKLAADLEKLKSELQVQENALEQREKRINELEDLLAKKDEAVNALKDKVQEALLGFKDKGLTVETRNGKVYVNMEAKLLFSTGSTKVGTEGKKALVELAKVLEDEKDMEVIVEGHTDTDQLNSSSYPHNNWELSVLRATSVVEIMLDNSNMDPKILSASGRSEFHPESDDKSKNRRIEIILAPNLDKLFEVINQ